ncbi:hypothetical protein AALP_AA8G015900 [Arabis alpina]|uniref:Intimal thickness related receptor IRP domain-containing protein n=1 Tax=Arabis alpina TaxID=50452 RepID=A0A087G4B8_ARAAL|nr:hypothetical protein AALP_AA8G015900 [Arabis alpina]
MTKLLPLLAVVFTVLFSTVTVAEIKSLTISDDSRPIILLEKFRFTQTGLVTISVSSVSLSSQVQDSSRLGFFVLSDESLPDILFELERNFSFCVLDSHYILRLFTFHDLSSSNFTRSYQVTSPNDYLIFFANCVPESKVSMNIKTELYNLDPTNGSKDYLSTGLTQLPGLYFIFSICYLSFFTLCGYFWYKNKQIVQRIHLLMTALLLSKALSMICAFEVKHNVRVTGEAHGWNIVFYVLRFIEDVLLFVVIVLIGTGWSLLKPKLQGKKKLLLMIVIPFQVLANIASVVIGETGPYVKDWVTWNQIQLLANIISCCAVIFTMCCSLRRKTLKTDGKNLAKLPMFRGFYVLVIVYLVFTRIGVFVLDVIVAYEYQWVSNAVGEIASLVFYVLMFYMFRPTERNEYFGVDDEEEEAMEVALKKEELEL